MEEIDLNVSDLEISYSSPPQIPKSEPPKVPPKPSKSRQSIASGYSSASLPNIRDNANIGLLDCCCPFYKLHHTTPCEFLSLEIEEEEKNIFLGIDDPTSKTDDKIKFIISNLKMCGGIWPLMFMEKLNRLIVNTDYKTVKACLHEDNFSLIYKLIKLYAEEQRCSVVFRYWCLFYNMLSRDLLPYPVFAVSELVDLLKRDFMVAANGLCRCKKESCVLDSLAADTLDEEHTKISPNVQMQITSILLIPLFTARAGLKSLKLSCELATETEFVLQVLKIIDDGEEPALFRISNNMSPTSGDNTPKTILVHLLLAYNLQFETKSRENPVAEAVTLGIKEFGGLSVFKAKSLTIFLQEADLLNTDIQDGSRPFISPPLGYQIAGVNGPLKLFIDLNNSDRIEFFDVKELKFIRTWSVKIQKMLSHNGFWDDKTEEIFSNSRMLQDLVELKLRNFPFELGSSVSGNESGSEQSQENPGYFPRENNDTSDCGSNDDLLNAEDTRKLCSNNSIAQKSKDGFLKPKIVMWPVEVVMKCFGCSKRKSSVSPASKTDVDQGYI